MTRAAEKLTDWFPEDEEECEHCGGEGFIAACDGDSSDWGEDTYSGPLDAIIRCRHCNPKRRK